MPSDPSSRLITADGRRPRVAVVAGQHAASMVATMLVEQFGCTWVAAPSGEAALALLRQEAGIDLVIIDLGIADMDGAVAAQLIRALGPHGSMPIIALTSAHADDAAPRGRAAGFSASLAKPYSPRELYGALQNALAKSSVAAG